MKPFARCMGLLVVFLLLSGGWNRLADAQTPPAPVKKWIAGLYAFSDELGGMRIVSVTGRGTLADPAIITQDVQTIGPSVLTVRPVAALSGLSSLGLDWTSLHLEIRSVNRSEAGWIGYHLELQEEIGKASIYGDGLSFNQLSRKSDNILSSRFANHELEYEPGDRLVFRDGWVDRLDVADFRFFVLDLTPSPVFYIHQVPRVPSS